MSIAAIIEKYDDLYHVDDYIFTGITRSNLPALTAELETLMREEAIAFATMLHMADKPVIVDDLYEQFKQTKEQ